MRINLGVFPCAHSESRGETPAPHCTKHNHMLLFPYTRALNPPICFPPNAQPLELLSLNLYMYIIEKKNTHKRLRLTSGNGPVYVYFPVSYQALLSFIYWPSAAALTSALASVSHSVQHKVYICECQNMFPDTTSKKYFLTHLFSSTLTVKVIVR